MSQTPGQLNITLSNLMSLSTCFNLFHSRQLGVVKPVDRYGRIARIILKERMGGIFERILLMLMGR